MRNIQPLQFVLTRYAERHEQGDQLEQDKTHPSGPDEGDRDPVELDQELDAALRRWEELESVTLK